MSLAEFARSMLRRWYVVVACLALTAAGAYATAAAVPPRYESTASVILLPPTSVVTATGNPYLYMAGLDEALSVLVVTLNSAEVSDVILNGHQGADYIVQKDMGATGPLLHIVVEAAAGDASLDLLDTVLERLPVDLADMQDELNVSQDARITSLTVVQSAEPVKIVKEQMRALLGVLAMGIALTILVTALADRWMLARASRRNVPEEDRSEVEGLEPTAPSASHLPEDWDGADPDPFGRPKQSAEFVSSSQP